MKALFTAFPLLKKKRFYFVLALILLFCGLTGIFYTREETAPLPSFEEEKGAIEEALDTVNQSLAVCEESEKGRFLQEKAYYESALKFKLSPWGSDFAYEGLSLYASLSVSGEKKDTLKTLEELLSRRDALGLYELCKNDPELPDLDKRLLTAEDSRSPGNRALLYDISLLEQSLETGTDRYSRLQRTLSQREKALYEDLLQQKEELLLSGDCNPVPLNTNTLLTFEKLIALFLTVLFLAVAGFGTVKAQRKAIAFFPLPLMGTVLLCTVILLITTLVFAPGTVQRYPVQWGGSLPFFPGLFLRLSCRVAGSLPLMLLCFYYRDKGKGKAWKILALLPALRVLFFGERTLVSVFSVGDLAWSLFPDLSAFAMRPLAPWAGVLLWVAALGLTLFLLMKKEQKITAEKQELSLEKQKEL